MAGAVLLGGTALSTTGCAGFFVCQKASCPSTGTITANNSGDYAYVSNSLSGSSYIDQLGISSSGLAPVANPLNVGFTPVAMNVSPANTYLYVASSGGASSPGVYLYSIGSGGVLSAANGGSRIIADQNIAAMTISPDGNFLFTVDTITVSNVTSVVLYEYNLNTSTGLVQNTSPYGTFATNGASCTLAGTPLSQVCSVTVSPSGDLVAVALSGGGTSGVETYSYSSGSGIGNGGSAVGGVPPLSSASGDFSLAFDANDYLYVASTAALTSYDTLTTTPYNTVNTQSFVSGVTPRSVILAKSYGYVYTADEGNSTISEFSQTTGTMTLLGSPPGPTNVSALGADNSGLYVVAAGYNSSSGIQLFSIGSAGALTQTGTEVGSGTSTSVPTVLAMTH
jgi:6-phosphogluconolactonase (cycloisomerase 2 family)